MSKINLKIQRNKLMALQNKRVNIEKMPDKVKKLPNTQKQYDSICAEIELIEAELAAGEQTTEPATPKKAGQTWPPDEYTVTQKLLDPRPDLGGDSMLWHRLLASVIRKHPVIYSNLHALRCGGAVAQKDEGKLIIISSNEEWKSDKETFYKLSGAVKTDIAKHYKKEVVTCYDDYRGGQTVIEC